MMIADQVAKPCQNAEEKIDRMLKVAIPIHASLGCPTVCSKRARIALYHSPPAQFSQSSQCWKTDQTTGNFF